MGHCTKVSSCQGPKVGQTTHFLMLDKGSITRDGDWGLVGPLSLVLMNLGNDLNRVSLFLEICQLYTLSNSFKSNIVGSESTLSGASVVLVFNQFGVGDVY